LSIYINYIWYAPPFKCFIINTWTLLVRRPLAIFWLLMKNWKDALPNHRLRISLNKHVYDFLLCSKLYIYIYIYIYIIGFNPQYIVVVHFSPSCIIARNSMTSFFERACQLAWVRRTLDSASGRFKGIVCGLSFSFMQTNSPLDTHSLQSLFEIKVQDHKSKYHFD
jgi:hypothetical protein